MFVNCDTAFLNLATAARKETTFDLTLELIITLLMAIKLDSEKLLQD